MLTLIRVLFLFSSTSVLAQVNMFETLEKRYSLDLDPERFPLLEIHWNFDGKIQGSVNAGLTELLDNKDYQRAVAHFDEAIFKLPSCVPALYYRAICQKLLGNTKEAKDDLTKASELTPVQPEILLELAELYESEWDYTAASKIYDRAIEANPDFVDVHFNLANLAMRQRNYPRAIRLLKKAVQIDPKFIEAHVRLGILAFALDKKGSKTIPHFESALAIDSTFQAALFWRGMMYLKDEEISKCLDSWTKLVRYNPEDPMFLMLRAFLFLDLKDYEKAFLDLKDIFTKVYTDENAFRGAQSMEDKRLDLQFSVSYIIRNIYGLDDQSSKHIKNGFCYLVMDRYAEAVSEFKQSFEKQPSALAHFMRALSYEHSQKHDSAFVFYDEALKLDNDIFDAHKKRAIYFSELKDWRNAYKDFEEMIRLEPGFTVTYRLRSMIRLEFKDYYGAIIDLTRYLRIDSTDHEIYLYRAYAKENVDDLKGANQDYRKALEREPKSYELYQNVIESDLQIADTAHAVATIKSCQEKVGLQTPFLFSTLVRIYINRGQFTEAQDEIVNVLNSRYWAKLANESEQSNVYFLDGWVHYLQRDYENALRKLDKAIAHNERNFEALYLRSKMFMARGDRGKAIRDLKTLASAGYSDSQKLLDELR